MKNRCFPKNFQTITKLVITEQITTSSKGGGGRVEIVGLKGAKGMKERRIIQISTAITTGENDTYTVALCDDGTVWSLFNERNWVRLVDIPQDQETDDRHANVPEPIRSIINDFSRAAAPKAE